MINSNRDFSDILDPCQRLGLEMLRGSASILNQAKARGYLDAGLNFIIEPPVVKLRRAHGRQTRTHIPGFQPDLVTCRRDIEDEVEFWRSDLPMDMANCIGLNPRDESVLLGWFAGQRGHGNRHPIS